MQKLEFKDKFDAVLCLDGTLPGKEFLKKFKDVVFLAADGAAIHLIKRNINFDKVIGDLDTLERRGYFDQIPEEKMIYLPDQDYNDFDKALNYCNDNNLQKVLITGIHGGELEHTLNNWSVLIKYAGKLNLCIYETGRYGIPLSKSCSLTVKKEESVSLIPQSKAILTLTGFKWGLYNELLELGIREGHRNIAVSEEIVVDIHSGSVLMFVDSKEPFAPNFI